MDRFACGYCGAELIVERSGGTVSLKLVEETLESIRTGTDKTAAEPAISRLQAELRPIEGPYLALQSQIQQADREIAEGEAAAQRIAALHLDLQAKRRKELASQIGCFSSVIWGAVLLALLSSLGAMGVLAAIATVVVVDVMCFVWILQSQPIETEAALQIAKSQLRNANEKAAWRAEAVKELGKMKLAVLELRKRLEDKKRIADS